MSKIEWKDASSYAMGEEKREPRTWSLRSGSLRLVVTRHLGFDDDEWVIAAYWGAANMVGPKNARSKELAEAKEQLLAEVATAHAAFGNALTGALEAS